MAVVESADKDVVPEFGVPLYGSLSHTSNAKGQALIIHTGQAPKESPGLKGEVGG